MQKTNLFTCLAIVFIITGMIACGPAKEQEAETQDTETEQEVKEETASITISKVTDSPAYEEASLSMTEPTDEGNIAAGEVSFNFNVENYELGAQTPDAETKGLANSGKGQHIHLIINNGPYSAHYEPSFTKSLEEGSHVVLAFLSRSYHESVKNANAFAVQKVTVGEETAVSDADLSAPHMFYSRPKGTYEGDDTKKLLLDFYLVNTTLSPDGNKVRATINGTEFMIDEWAPHQIEGLPLGEVTVKLELIDANGELIASPFNPVERTVTLK
ncbi:MAG: phosphopeptide-binding protein [Bacteroidota bacterium]